MGEDRVNYTGAPIAETAADAATSFVAAWTPVIKGAFGEGKDAKIIHADGSEDTFAEFGADGKTLTVSLAKGDKVAYQYDNIIIPQNDLPVLNARTKDIPLVAKARRISVYYKKCVA